MFPNIVKFNLDKPSSTQKKRDNEPRISAQQQTCRQEADQGKPMRQAVQALTPIRTSLRRLNRCYQKCGT